MIPKVNSRSISQTVVTGGKASWSSRFRSAKYRFGIEPARTCKVDARVDVPKIVVLLFYAISVFYFKPLDTVRNAEMPGMGVRLLLAFRRAVRTFQPAFRSLVFRFRVSYRPTSKTLPIPSSKRDIRPNPSISTSVRLPILASGWISMTCR